MIKVVFMKDIRHGEKITLKKSTASASVFTSQIRNIMGKLHFIYESFILVINLKNVCRYVGVMFFSPKVKIESLVAHRRKFLNMLSCECEKGCHL